MFDNYGHAYPVNFYDHVCAGENPSMSDQVWSITYFVIDHQTLKYTSKQIHQTTP